MDEELVPAGWILTEHARRELARRHIATAAVAEVLRHPGQRLAVRPGREVWQSVQLLDHPSKPYLVRVVVDLDRAPREVVTAYRTSKIRKYWRQG